MTVPPITITLPIFAAAGAIQSSGNNIPQDYQRPLYAASFDTGQSAVTALDLESCAFAGKRCMQAENILEEIDGNCTI
jgi:hypothetical protein